MLSFVCFLFAAVLFDVTVAALWSVFMRALTGQWTGNLLHVRVNHFVLAAIYCGLPSVIYGIAAIDFLGASAHQNRMAVIKNGMKWSGGIGMATMLVITLARGRIDLPFFGMAAVVVLLFMLAGASTAWLGHSMFVTVQKRRSE